MNFVSVNECSINALCGSMRAKVWTRLLDEKYPVVQPPTQPPASGGWAPTPGAGPNVGSNPTNPWYDPVGQFDPSTIESPQIRVVVRNLFGMEGEETQQLSLQMEFVTVTNFELQLLDDEISVEVTDFKLL